MSSIDTQLFSVVKLLPNSYILLIRNSFEALDNFEDSRDRTFNNARIIEANDTSSYMFQHKPTGLRVIEQLEFGTKIEHSEISDIYILNTNEDLCDDMFVEDECLCPIFVPENTHVIVTLGKSCDFTDHTTKSDDEIEDAEHYRNKKRENDDISNKLFDVSLLTNNSMFQLNEEVPRKKKRKSNKLLFTFGTGIKIKQKIPDHNNPAVQKSIRKEIYLNTQSEKT